MDNPYLIWWLCEADYELFGDEGADPADKPRILPDYLRRQVAARYGRPGRGRLWADACLKDVPLVIPSPDTPLASRLSARDYGGIVFRREDLAVVMRFPGVVTDFSLTPLWELPFITPSVVAPGTLPPGVPRPVMMQPEDILRDILIELRETRVETRDLLSQIHDRLSGPR